VTGVNKKPWSLRTNGYGYFDTPILSKCETARAVQSIAVRR
jgi:hypothetical protein